MITGVLVTKIRMHSELFAWKIANWQHQTLFQEFYGHLTEIQWYEESPSIW